MRGVLFGALIGTFLLSGCVGDSPTDYPEVQGVLVARDLSVAIQPGQFWHLDFSTTGGQAGYDLAVTQGGPISSGFMRTQNLPAVADGAPTTMYGHAPHSYGARESAVLDYDDWSLVVFCHAEDGRCNIIVRNAYHSYDGH